MYQYSPWDISFTATLSKNLLSQHWDFSVNCSISQGVKWESGKREDNTHAPAQIWHLRELWAIF